jgi:hypothetical protein
MQLTGGLHLLMKGKHHMSTQKNPRKSKNKKKYKNICLKIMQEKGITHPP